MVTILESFNLLEIVKKPNYILFLSKLYKYCFYYKIINKKQLTEAETKFILPAIEKASWNRRLHMNMQKD